MYVQKLRQQSFVGHNLMCSKTREKPDKIVRELKLNKRHVVVIGLLPVGIPKIASSLSLRTNR